MKYLMSLVFIFVTAFSNAMQPPAAMNPAAIHTMHHSANVVNQPNIQGVAPGQIQSGSQYYEGNLDGLRKYVDTLQVSQPELYKQLDSKLSKLETRNTVGNVVQIAGVVGWLAMSLAQDVENPDTTTPLILLVGGFGAGYAIRPSRSDYLDIINENNRLNPSRQLEMGFNIRPATNGLGVSLAYGF